MNSRFQEAYLIVIQQLLSHALMQARKIKTQAPY
jgi:hypothetical protein